MKEAGIIITEPYDSDKKTTRPTFQCTHCGRHFEVIKGSGRKRGWCLNCNGPTCSAKCENCVHRRQLLENLAAGRPRDFKPVRASVAMHLRGNAGRRARKAK